MFKLHCAEFDTRRLFSLSSAEEGKFHCAHFKTLLMCVCVKMTQLDWQQTKYAIYMYVMIDAH